MISAPSTGWEERVDAEGRAERDAETLEGIVAVFFSSSWLFMLLRRGCCNCRRWRGALLSVGLPYTVLQN